MKKRILLVTLALVLLLTLTGCSNKVVGTWKNNTLSKLTLELNSDKTFKHTQVDGIYSSIVYTGTYTVFGNKITLNADLYEYYSSYSNSDGELINSEASDEVFEATYADENGDVYIDMDGYKYHRAD